MKDWFKGLPRDARRVFAACFITATLFLYTSSRAIGWYVNGSANVDEPVSNCEVERAKKQAT